MGKFKSPKKDEKDSEKEVEDKSLVKNDETLPRPEYSELVKTVNVIAKPLAGRKLTKRLYKTVKKGWSRDNKMSYMNSLSLTKLSVLVWAILHRYQLCNHQS